jgi:hypothetical protein
VFLDTSLDWCVLAFTASVAVAVALLFGVVPALRASRTEPIDAIRQHSRTTPGERGIGFGGALVPGRLRCASSWSSLRVSSFEHSRRSRR